MFYDQLQIPDVKIDDLVQQLHEIVQSKVDVTLVGHSWGATLGLEYAKRFPGEISKLVFMSSGLDFAGWKVDFEAELFKRRISKDQPELIYLSQSERGGWTSFLESLWETFSNKTFDSLFESYLRNFDLKDFFQKNTIPLLCIFGEDDLRFPLSAARKLKLLNPNIRYIEVGGAGHFPFLLQNHRDFILKEIRDFMCL